MIKLDPSVVSDKRKLIIVVSLLLSIGFMATSLVSYFASRNSIRQSIVLTELPLTSDNVYSEIQKDLVRPIFISSMMASDTFLRDWVLKGESDMDQMSKYLKEVKSRYGAFTSFFISEQTRTYYHANGVLKKISKDDPRDVWYFRVRDMKAPYEINVDPDQANRDALTIFINYRVFDYDGRFIGVSGIGLTVDAVRKLIDDYKRRYHRDIYFVDGKGNLILFGNYTAGAGENIRAIPGLGLQADSILKSQAGSYQYQRDGQVHLLNVRFVPELHWYLFVDKQEDEALLGIRNTLYWNLAICLAITGVVVLLTSLTINRYQRRLEDMATIDKLTGLINRQAFEVISEQALREAGRSNEPLSAILVDIDHFKDVNDQYGHFAGDVVIEGVAKAARTSLREVDLLCRWGGEEYLVLLKSCDMENAKLLAEKIRVAVEKAIFKYHEITISVTVSIGVAQYSGNETIEHLLSRTDKALYVAKNAGRNRVSFI